MLPIYCPVAPGKNTYGNSILRLMYSMHLQQYLENSQIVGFDLPEFGLTYPELWEGRDSLLTVGGKGISKGSEEYLPIFMRSLKYQGIKVHALGLDYSLLLPNKEWLSSVIENVNVDPIEMSDDEMLVSIRGGEIERPIHKDYYPLPVSFYRAVEANEASGMRLCFIGQTYSKYGRALRQEFPNARFVDSNPLQAFKTIWAARDKLIPVSTFAWLAAWASPCASRIVMPLAGLFNPLQRPDINLVPWADSRYTFRWFEPKSRWYPTVKRKLIDFSPSVIVSKILDEFLRELEDSSRPYPTINSQQSNLN